MKMRVPATPIITIDPYFSVWTTDSVLGNTVHWTDKPNTMCGRVYIDGSEYHFFGMKTRSEQNIPNMKMVNMQVDAFSTIITYVNDVIKLTVHFTSPLLVDDLYYASRPVAYCKTTYVSLDAKPHDVRIKFIASEELVLSTKGEGRALAHKTNISGVTAIKMGNGVQNVLWRSGDVICIDWGYLYLGVKGEGTVTHTVFNQMYAISVEAKLEKEALFLFGYDDVDSIQYFGENLKAYWKKDGKTMEEAVAEAAQDYDVLLERCNEFSVKVQKEAIEKGNEEYAELLLLSVRQIMAAHKLVVDKEGNNLYFSKECYSNGCAATVDITYPSSPIFLLYNTELLKSMIRPIMQYAASEEWCFDFAPHDLGQYPLVNGQAYGVRRDKNGNADIDFNMQMPVEECGNLIILFAAICDAENDVSFVAEHMDTLEKWSEYLIKYGLDPENQLCTDDFAGHLAHNVNLSIKAIMGIAGYSRILARLEKHEKANNMMNLAKEYATSVVERARNEDGSYRLAYDKPETFSLKYNAIWDKLWKTNLFPENFYRGEILRYQRELLTYGVPLDSRERYTKSDWLVWVASLAENKNDFDEFIHSLWLAYDTMRTRVPMTDWYYADTSEMRFDGVCGFRNRTVQGGLFMKLLFDND